MSKMPKFNMNNPSGKEEELIVELIDQLGDTVNAFMKLNHHGNMTLEIFVVLRDGCIGFSARMISDLIKILIDKNQKLLFIKEAKEIFDAYMDELRKELLDEKVS